MSKRSGSSIRLLVIGVQWPPETFLRRKLEGLSSRGVDVTVAAHWRAKLRREDAKGIRLIPLGAPRALDLFRALVAPRRLLLALRASFESGIGVREIARRLKAIIPVLAEKPNVVHFEWNSAAIDYLPFLGLWSAPVVISCRGTQVFIRPHVTPSYAGLLAQTFEAATAVHCVCVAIRDEAVGLGLDIRKAEVIRPAVDLTEFQPVAKVHSSQLRLAAVGALIWRKGYEYMLLALRDLLALGVPARLDIVGDGGDAARIHFTMEDLGLASHVTLHGSLPPSGVRSILEHTDVFVHTSLGEGISNGVLEAMACGIPIVTADSGGMREAVRDGHDGFVVSPRDPGAIATAIAKLARNSELREQMGRNARATIQARFGLEDQIGRFIALYQRAIAARGTA